MFVVVFACSVSFFLFSFFFFLFVFVVVVCFVVCLFVWGLKEYWKVVFPLQMQTYSLAICQTIPKVKLALHSQIMFNLTKSVRPVTSHWIQE